MSEHINRAYYSIIPANVRYDDELTPNAKLLYGEITALCNDKGYCWATNDYFATLYNVSKRTISNWISQLNQKGYITIELKYKEGSSEIQHRYIRILQSPIEENFHTPRKELPHPIEENFHTPRKELPHPIEENFHTPIEENFADNNTVINNTFNNTIDNYIVQIVDYLNKVCGTRYKPDSKKTRSLIKARLKEKYTVEDFKKVIFTMYSKWKGTEWEQYLRPATLFNEGKFEGYLNQFKGGDLDAVSTKDNGKQSSTGPGNEGTKHTKGTKQYEDDITRALRGRKIDLTDNEEYDF